MYYKQLLCAALLLSISFAASCARTPARIIDRIAILPLENLTSDATLGWVPAAAQNALVRQLTGVGNLLPLGAANTREALQQRADRAVEGYLSGDANVLRLHIVIEDLGAVKTQSAIDITGRRQKGVLPLLDQLAKVVNPLARPFSTSSDAALEMFAKGNFSGAVQSDAGFGAAYVNWLVQLRSKGDRDSGLEVLSKAKSQGTKLNDLDRAQIDVAAAWLKPEDKNSRRAAMMNLAAIVKYDTQLFRELSEAAQQASNFKAAAEWLEKALTVDPSNTGFLNSLAYAYALGGDLAASERTIGQYRKLAPGDANTFDSMGEIYFMAGKFGEAEKSFADGFEKMPQFLGGALMYKAALSRLMSGDEIAANERFAKYREFRQTLNDPEAEAHAANWEFLTGHRKAAIARMSKAVTPRGRAQLALMLLMSGDRAAARKQAEAAMQPPQPDRQLGPLALFLSSPANTVAEWQAIAGRFFGPQASPVVKDQFLAYALFIERHNAEVAALLAQQVMNANPLAESMLREMYAAALVASGKVEDAAPLVAMYPVPEASNENPFASLTFPRLFETRAAVLEKQGKAAEAKAMRQLATKFAPR